MNDTYITFSGWVGTAPELRELPGGQQVASFRVASTPRRLRDGQWEDGPTTWHQVKAWRRLAGHAAESLRTGDPVLVHGRLVADVWKKPDGSLSTQLVVVASSVGHDLNHGTSAFSKPRREVEAVPSPEQVGAPGVEAA